MGEYWIDQWRGDRKGDLKVKSGQMNPRRNMPGIEERDVNREIDEKFRNSEAYH